MRSKRNSCSHVRGLLGEERPACAHVKSYFEKVKCSFTQCNGTLRWRWTTTVTTSEINMKNKISVYNIHQCSQLLSLMLYYFMGYSTGPYRGWQSQTTPNWTKGKGGVKIRIGGWHHLLQSWNNCQLYGLVKNFRFEFFSPRSIVHVYSQDSQEGCEITISYIMFLNLVILHCCSTIHLYSSWQSKQ